MPESGVLIPGVENRIYVLTLYPNNTPAMTTCTARIGDEVVGTVETDAAGVGVIRFMPVGHSSLVLDLHAADASGNAADRTLDLALSAAAESLLLRTDRSLYAVGDEVKLDVFCGGLGGSVFVDVIKDGQTVASRSLEPLNGFAALVLPLTADLSGSLCVSAYRITLAGNTVRDRRIIYVDPANDLRLTYAADREVYLPGDEAAIRLQVADPAGQPVVAAIGLNFVDEAVFALQEMQPGMEKIYFYLEEQLRRPRYEIHGFDPGTVLHEPPGGTDDATREQVLGMMFAALPDANVGTFEVTSDAADPAALSAVLRDAVWNDLDRLIDPMLAVFTTYDVDRSPAFFEPLIEEAVANKTLGPDGALDPWGTPYRVSYAAVSTEYTFHTAGPDQRWETPDDLQFVVATWALGQSWMRKNAEWLARGGVGGFEVFAMNNADWLEDAVGGPPTPTAGGGSESGGAEPYLRQYFPETLYSNPLLITGPDGSTTVNVKLADSITTWRMTGLASSADGRLGSATGAVRVFQEFFVDLDLPATLTRGDEVSVPVAVYNYLPESQDVRLVLEGDDGVELLESAERTLSLAAAEVNVVHFRVKTLRVGHCRLQVTAYGSTKSDAIARTVEVVPDGAEMLVTQSGRLSGLIEHLITIPEAAIDGASKILVKIHPGFFSQVVEGLDAMLRMPFGCFEQTSSVTYPNVLVVDYMKQTGVITPEILMKAEGFISAGYQRLLSYEVDGGGFSWFGEAPAHNVLTTYGLMEFSDMSGVWYVDPAVIRRTQDWLVAGQEADGSWIPTDGGIAEGAINRYQNDVLRTTAYVLWGLVKSGYTGPALNSGAAYLRNKLSEPGFEAETYTL
ncbi:MAG: alpha-2-macroglobulin, partial [Verrucomicrobiae bacterium]|nr:alpha-2-macroglobulin [Verrucomicrobiae bacterium]